MKLVKQGTYVLINSGIGHFQYIFVGNEINLYKLKKKKNFRRFLLLKRKQIKRK